MENKLPPIYFGWNLAVGFVVFFLLGFWADKHYGTTYRYTLIGMMMGVVFFIYELWKIIRSKR